MKSRRHPEALNYRKQSSKKAPQRRFLHEPLTDRQIEILRLVAKGESTHAIGQLLGISHKTVNNHLGIVYQRLETANLTQAVLRAARLGIIDLG